KIGAIAMLVLCGLLLAPAATGVPRVDATAAAPLGIWAGLGAALTPVMFSYGGWQTSGFVAGEMRDPRRDLVRALLLGVLGVVILYTLVGLTCVVVLGPEGLAQSPTPASAVMRLALGETGGALIALGIAISALGFLSQGMLTAPRVYFAMAEDGLFFRGIATVGRRSRAPVAAILLQGAAACLIALSGTYGQILSYVVSVDFIFFGLTGAALFVFRRRDPAAASFRAPGHPWTTLIFVLACAATVAGTIWNHPVNSAIGFLILLSGVPVCLFWLQRRRRAS
ncbi:MAG TPA: amino acid permease, partial [Sphingomonas sp.]|nr:amino acid permease [Sphingomonas sp.]